MRLNWVEIIVCTMFPLLPFLKINYVKLTKPTIESCVITPIYRNVKYYSKYHQFYEFYLIQLRTIYELNLKIIACPVNKMPQLWVCELNRAYSYQYWIYNLFYQSCGEKTH